MNISITTEVIEHDELCEGDYIIYKGEVQRVGTIYRYETTASFANVGTYGCVFDDVDPTVTRLKVEIS